jgi:hypothetical protein
MDCGGHAELAFAPLPFRSLRLAHSSAVMPLRPSKHLLRDGRFLM